jgi:mannose/fructose/N-acetylgalactosamine-specific phosphotransferase system component IID
VPQGSVLGPILFLVFINNLDRQTELLMAVEKFADHHQLGQVIKTDQDREALQQILDKLTDWVSTWSRRRSKRRDNSF